MNKEFYTQENLNYLKKRVTRYLVLSIIFVLLFIATFITTLLLATRDNKSLVLVLGGLSLVILVVASIIFLSLLGDSRRKYIQFKQIYEDNGKEVLVTYIKRNEHSISLQDKSTVYEIYFRTNEGEKCYYLVTLFDFDFVENKEYTITLVSEFIKGVKC